MRFAVATIVIALLMPLTARAEPTGGDPHTDTVPSFVESSGCGPLDGVRGPLMGPGPIEAGFPYSFLPDETELFGPWGDMFGRSIGEVRTGLVVVHLPGQAKDLYIHQHVLPAFNEVLANLAIEAANGNVYEVRTDTWSFSPATIPPRRHLSFHGVGASIDVNSATNPYRGDNVLETDMPQWFVDAWRDAGWCWGGDWVTIKDPMHFAWMGPIHTPNYGPDPAPYTPVYAASSFDRAVEVPNSLNITIPSGAQFAMDVDANGAADAVRFQQSFSTGEFRLEVALADRNSEVCAATGWAPAPAVAIDEVVMGDFTSDGRPELWFLDESEATVTAAIYTITSVSSGSSTITGVPQLNQTIATSIPSNAASTYLVEDHDRDGDAELYVITPGATTRLEVWDGPAYTSKVVDVTLAVASDTLWRFGLGDHDVDAIPDLYALSPDSPAALHVVHGAGGFAGAPTVITTGVTAANDETLTVADYDGDGRDDLYLIGSDDGVWVILGGVRAVDADLNNWFVERDFTWSVGAGCSQAAYLRVATDPAVESQILIGGVPFDSWGLTWVKLPPGDHTVSFRDVEGFTTPASQVATVTEGATTEVTGSFVQRGYLQVTTNPAVSSTISVDGTPRNDWGLFTDLEPGDYQVCFGDVADYTAPACETATLTAGAITPVVGEFVSNPGAPAPTGHGMLRVVTNPAVPAQILVDGVPYDTWGLNWLKLVPGDYTVSFADVAGYTTPAAETVTVTADVATEVIGLFVPQGQLRVITSPAVPATILVDEVPRNDWGMWTDLAPAEYQVCFGNVVGYVAPACQTATVTAGNPTTITGIFIAE